jgi:hypothetical protein
MPNFLVKPAQIWSNGNPQPGSYFWTPLAQDSAGAIGQDVTMSLARDFLTAEQKEII